MLYPAVRDDLAPLAAACKPPAQERGSGRAPAAPGEVSEGGARAGEGLQQPLPPLDAPRLLLKPVLRWQLRGPGGGKNRNTMSRRAQSTLNAQVTASKAAAHFTCIESRPSRDVLPARKRAQERASRASDSSMSMLSSRRA